MVKRCNPKCIFFPLQSYEKTSKNFIIDENNIKHINTKPYCGFDDHLIKNWKNCENYREEFKNNQTNKESKAYIDKTIILLGKSACGKDSILNYLKEKYNFNPVISHTTRPIRQNEIDGKDYHFCDIKEFSKMIKNNEFLEIREYTTCFDGKQDIWYYGISKNEFDNKNRKICIIDTKGQKEILKYLRKENVISIYIDTKDEIRENRAKLRGSFSQEEWNRRLKDDNKKFKSVIYDYVVYNNGTKEECEENIENILKKEGLI